MKFISNSIPICDVLKSKTPGIPFACVYEEFGCRNNDDMSIVNEALKAMNRYGYLIFSNDKITYQSADIQKYQEFYKIRSAIEAEYQFLIQALRDAFAIGYFKKVKFTTAIARPITISSIYNFSSAVTIAINKVLKDGNGKYNIDILVAKLGRFLKQYGMSSEQKELKKMKMKFSAYKKAVDDDIRKFNDFRDELFAHSDNDSQLKVEQVDDAKALKIITECFKYCVECINLIDDDKIDSNDVKKTVEILKLEASYFTAQLIRK